MKTVLALAQEFCRRQALPVPTSVVNAQDDQTLQIWGLLNEGQMDLVDRGDWQELRLSTPYFTHGGYPYPGAANQPYVAAYISEAGTASTIAQEGGVGGFGPQGSGYYFAPGLKSIIANTFWCTSTRLPVYGPVTTEQWAYMTALQVQPAQFVWRMEGNRLLIFPYNGNVSFVFKYQTRFPTYDATTNPATANPYPSYDGFYSDSYASLLPDKVVLQDLKWRWKATKGLPYAEDARICEEMITNALSSNQPAPELTLDDYHTEKVAGPGLLVAAGSWPL